MDDLSKLVGSQNQKLAGVNMDLNEQKRHQEQALIGAEITKVATLERELKKHKQANEALHEALREIGEIATAVRRGDLSKRVQFQSVGTDPEIAICKRTINAMMSHLQDVSSNVSRLAREAGIEGILGGKAFGAVEGAWEELITSVNFMAETLTIQVRETAMVTTAIARGDLTQKMKWPAKGEILELQRTINAVVDHLRSFCAEVTSVVRDVGTEGNLGGQVDIKNIEGTWNTLAANVNAMATTLTTQVRDIDEVATAVAEGNFTQRLPPVGKGEILELRSTINSMIDQLQQLQGPSEA